MASQPAAGTPSIECLKVPSFVQGYHTYKDIWEPENGEMLELKRERVELHTSLAGSTMMLISNLAEAHRSSIAAS